MSLEKKLKAEEVTDLEQFEDCPENLKDCKYINNNGKCIYEKCKFTEEPALVANWTLECQFCTEKFIQDPRTVKVHVCPTCISRIREAEKRPYTCIFCNKKYSSRPPMFGTRICKRCISRLRKPMTCKDCGNPPVL